MDHYNSVKVIAKARPNEVIEDIAPIGQPVSPKVEVKRQIIADMALG